MNSNQLTKAYKYINMQQFSPSAMCDVIDITLYKFNYYDNLIWTKCLNQIDYMIVDDDSILVTPRQLEALFELNFERTLRKLEATTPELIHRDAHSIYFIDRLTSEFNRLKWVKLTLSRNRNFSRIADINGVKNIKYSFKVLKTTLRLSEMFDFDDISQINPILKKLDLIKNKPYNRMSTHMLINKIDGAINGGVDLSEHQVELLASILDILDFKIETDNPEVLLVTDW